MLVSTSTWKKLASLSGSSPFVQWDLPGIWPSQYRRWQWPFLPSSCSIVGDYYKNVQISVKLAITAVTITVTVPPGFLKMESAAESPMMLNKQKSQLFGPSFTFSNTMYKSQHLLQQDRSSSRISRLKFDEICKPIVLYIDALETGETGQWKAKQPLSLHLFILESKRNMQQNHIEMEKINGVFKKKGS